MLRRGSERGQTSTVALQIPQTSSEGPGGGGEQGTALVPPLSFGLQPGEQQATDSADGSQAQ